MSLARSIVISSADVRSSMHAASEIHVGHSSPQRGRLPESPGRLGRVDWTIVQERIVDFLRRKYPTKCAESVEAETGIPAATVAKWLVRNSGCKADSFARLLCAYGPEFACAVMPRAPAWLDRARREAEAERLRAEIAALEARLEGTVS